MSYEGLRVVVTGASSGIGRATAVAFAARGARVALAARRREVLEDAARECRRAGGEALVVPTDVTDMEAVRGLAEAARRAWGGIDVWVNDAGLGVVGPYHEGDIALHRRTIEVNLLGPMHGASAVLPVFLAQGHGLLVNTISVGAWIPTPYAAAYTASKFGLRGFTASLRQELGDQPDIHVCGVFPAVIDTPGLERAANVGGRRIDPGPFLYAPEDVAQTIVRLVDHPRDEVAVGWPARAAQVAYALAPGPTEHVMGALSRRAMRSASPAPRTEGSLLRAIPEGRSADGGWRARKGVPSAGTISRTAGLALLAGALLLFGTRAAARSSRS